MNHRLIHRHHAIGGSSPVKAPTLRRWAELLERLDDPDAATLAAPLTAAADHADRLHAAANDAVAQVAEARRDAARQIADGTTDPATAARTLAKLEDKVAAGGRPARDLALVARRTVVADACTGLRGHTEERLVAILRRVIDRSVNELVTASIPESIRSADDAISAGHAAAWGQAVAAIDRIGAAQAIAHSWRHHGVTSHLRPAAGVHPRDWNWAGEPVPARDPEGPHAWKELIATGVVPAAWTAAALLAARQPEPDPIPTPTGRGVVVA